MAYSKSSLRTAGWDGTDLVSAAGESALLQELISLAKVSSPGIEIGPGDDAAGWQARSPGFVLCSTDTICEGVDFRRGYQTPYQVGWKGWMAAVSDLSAMGASPRGGLVAALVPVETSTEALLAIQLGVVEAAAVDRAVVLGGDLSRTTGPLALSVTVLGEVADGAPVALGGGSAGDRIVLTGTLGRAAAALRALEEGSDSVRAEWLERLLTPPSRVAAGVALRRAGCSAMTDLSDGLLLDLDRLCQASGVGAELWLNRLPLAEGLANSELGRELALAGGEDFELLATIPEDRLGELAGGWVAGLPPLALVGVLSPHPGTRLLSAPQGKALALPSTAGFSHF